MIDSYEALIGEYISKEDFFKYGLEKTIYIPQDKVEKGWKRIKDNINNNKAIYMRGFKDSTSTRISSIFYTAMFKNDYVKKDPSNTQTPAKLIEELSGYKKSKDLRNYQLASVFGKGRNALAFNAPWNIVYIPSILDPLLSSDSNSALAKEYQAEFQKHVYSKFKTYINEYNDIVGNHHFLRVMDEFFERMFEEGFYDREILAKFETIIREDFKVIKFN